MGRNYGLGKVTIEIFEMNEFYGYAWPFCREKENAIVRIENN